MSSDIHVTKHLPFTKFYDSPWSEIDFAQESSNTTGGNGNLPSEQQNKNRMLIYVCSNNVCGTVLTVSKAVGEYS